MIATPSSTNQPPPGHSDGSLVRQLAEGSPAAAKDLYSRYSDRIRALAARALTAGIARRVDADDLVQSVFRRFFEAVKHGRYNVPSAGDLGDLLVVITLNRVRSAEVFHRSSKRDVRRTVGGEALIGVPSGQLADGDLQAQFTVELQDVIERLPADHRQVVCDRMEGFEVAEIATRMGRSKRTVERMLQESRVQLQLLLEPATP